MMRLNPPAYESQKSSIIMRSHTLIRGDVIQGGVLDDLAPMLKLLVRAVEDVHCIWPKTECLAD
jgi:hypothetical protein